MHIVTGSWDGKVRLWSLTNSGAEMKLPPVQADAPVLSVCWSEDSSAIFYAGCDQRTTRVDLNTQQRVVVAQHDQPIKFARWIPFNRTLMTVSWDKTIRWWDGRQQAPALNVPLQDKPYCADVKDNVAVIATSSPNIHIFNLQNPQQPMRTVQSQLKFQSRCVKIFSDKSGFAVGSIEGRVAVNHVDPNRDSANFAFKCHRNDKDIYAINDIAFHNLGTFATCGSDGNYIFWDKDSKQKLKSFSPCPLPVTCCEFNPGGNLFAYAMGYDWSKGATAFNPAVMKPHLMLHQVNIDNIKPKSSKR